MWIVSDNKKFLVNVNQAKLIQREENNINIVFDEKITFVSEFKTEEEAEKHFNNLSDRLHAATFDNLTEF